MVSVWYSRTPHVLDVLEAVEAYSRRKGLDLHWAEWAHTHAQKQHTSAGSINIWVPPCKGRFSGWANQYMISIQTNDKIGRCQSGMYYDNRVYYPEILLGLLWAAADEFGKEDGLTVE